MGKHEKKQEKKLDRRAARSKRLIVGALRELILEKDFKKISVTDIVERADIGRATFYAHFEDKQALERYLFSMLLAQIEAEIDAILVEDDGSASEYQCLVPSLALFRISEEKHKWFKQNASRPDVGLGMLIKPLVARMVTRLEELGIEEGLDTIPRQTMANYLISALIAMLTEWILDDMPEPPEVVDAMYQSLAEPTLRRLVGI